MYYTERNHIEKYKIQIVQSFTEPGPGSVRQTNFHLSTFFFFSSLRERERERELVLFFSIIYCCCPCFDEKTHDVDKSYSNDEYKRHPLMAANIENESQYVHETLHRL